MNDLPTLTPPTRRGRPPNPERPVELHIKLRLYPSRHGGLIAFLQAAPSHAQAVIALFEHGRRQIEAEPAPVSDQAELDESASTFI